MIAVVMITLARGPALDDRTFDVDCH